MCNTPTNSNHCKHSAQCYSTELALLENQLSDTDIFGCLDHCCIVIRIYVHTCIIISGFGFYLLPISIDYNYV